MVHFPTCPARSQAKYCNLVNPWDTSIRMSNISTIFRVPQPPPNVGSLQLDAQGISRAYFTVLVAGHVFYPTKVAFILSIGHPGTRDLSCTRVSEQFWEPVSIPLSETFISTRPSTIFLARCAPNSSYWKFAFFAARHLIIPLLHWRFSTSESYSSTLQPRWCETQVLKERPRFAV
ncbi:hypothetical protein ARMSODRAFT_184454 [Armillaria solidipes]|uniref:Uncharacterized protein n=1 Tax=Armillaria solidipes TaxID=1076256 RepID=A0A2H3BCN8_9AGAR|nr:hypothetical protein ARMSODRAFT_184454 [Armillaria solidipes]